MSDPANEAEIAKMAVAQTTGYDEQQTHDALFRSWPVAVGGAPDGTKLEFPFAVDSSIQNLIKSSSAFLYKIHSIDQAELTAGAVDGSIAEEVLKEGSGPAKPIVGTPAAE
jgi:hypothetical protein